jgi:probable rRNA maturation factor
VVASKKSDNLLVRDFTKRRAPSLPYTRAIQTALQGFDISLVFVGEKRAQDLNKRLRGKDYVPNVLSYLVSNDETTLQKSGEIIICLSVAKKQAPLYEMSYKKFVLFLFIHGLLHLDGMQHGSTMEKRERKLLLQLLPD